VEEVRCPVGHVVSAGQVLQLLGTVDSFS
jgi:hypothetical protein